MLVLGAGAGPLCEAGSKAGVVEVVVVVVVVVVPVGVGAGALSGGGVRRTGVLAEGVAVGAGAGAFASCAERRACAAINTAMMTKKMRFIKEIQGLTSVGIMNWGSPQAKEAA